VNFINNTVISNDSTASSGVLFDTIGASLASTAGKNCIQTGSTTASCPQVAGLVSIQNSATLTANLAAGTRCPAGHGGASGTACVGATGYSIPLLYNDLFWQNRSYFIGVGSLGAGTLNQQNVVALYNAFGAQTTANQAASQTTTGQCVSGSQYWDIGVRGNTGPTNHNGGTLTPTYSFITNAVADGYGAAALHNSQANPTVMSQYCNGSRIPPEFQSGGWQVPPGIADATVPNPVFNLSPVATIDEGNNWINIAWGPLTMTNPVTNALLGNYALQASSTAINYIPTSANGAAGAYTLAPLCDYFGNLRKAGNSSVDVGAVEFGAAPGGGCGAAGGGGGQGTLSFSSATNATLATVLGVRTLTFTIPTPRAAVTSVITMTNSGVGSLQITAETLSLNIGSLYSITGTTCSFTTPLAPGGVCTVSVRYATPATRPILPDIGALSVANDGTGTVGGNSVLVLMAQ